MKTHSGKMVRKAEEFKEPVIRFFLSLLSLQNSPNNVDIYPMLDETSFTMKHFPKGFKERYNGKAGVYLFVLSTTNKLEEVRQSLDKMTTGSADYDDDKEALQTVIPAYVGLSGNVYTRYNKKHTACKHLGRLWEQSKLSLFLVIVPLEHPFAAAMEIMLLQRFDFFLNDVNNGGSRVEEIDRFFNPKEEDDVDHRGMRAPLGEVEGENFVDQLIEVSHNFQTASTDCFSQLMAHYQYDDDDDAQPE